MAKRALLIGCNYPGTDAELAGCVNDVFGQKSLFEEIYGFDDFTILIDTDKSYTAPTGRNIKDAMKEIVAKCNPGDLLVVHFSGHGTQVPSNQAEEADRKDECIVPTDLNLILDDDLRAIFKELKPNVHFTFISDCCHSGGMLDHEEVQIKGSKDSILPSLDMKGLMSAFGMRGTDGPPSNMRNRSLPPEKLVNILRSRTGEDVSLDNFQDVMRKFFAEDVSKKIQEAFGSFAQGINDSEVSKGFRAGLEHVKGFFGRFKGGDGEPKTKDRAFLPGKKSGDKLSSDVGILVTGCQSEETSADATPDDGKSYGALSNAIQTIVRAHVKKYKHTNVSAREVVLAVRGLLSEGKYKQNPCLECSVANAELAFITGAVIKK